MNFTCQDRYLGLYLFRVAGIAVREPQNVVAKPPQSVASVRVETLLILRIVVATIYLNDGAQLRKVQVSEILTATCVDGELTDDAVAESL